MGNEAEEERTREKGLQNEPVCGTQRCVGVCEDPKCSPAGAAGGEYLSFRPPDPPVPPSLPALCAPGGMWGRMQAVRSGK